MVSVTSICFTVIVHCIITVQIALIWLISNTKGNYFLSNSEIIYRHLLIQMRLEACCAYVRDTFIVSLKNRWLLHVPMNDTSPTSTGTNAQSVALVFINSLNMISLNWTIKFLRTFYPASSLPKSFFGSNCKTTRNILNLFIKVSERCQLWCTGKEIFYHKSGYKLVLIFCFGIVLIFTFRMKLRTKISESTSDY